ncbi:MAG: sodium:solute symporter [Muribaculum sp.]|nr:sodium:solute symporter [Muribaculum sp.]
MAFLDWIVIALFFVVMVGIIVWVMRQKQNNAEDYFLGGKDATWIAIGASIFASNIGSEHLIGLAGSGASSGMAMAHWEIQGWMILLLGWVFVPFYTRSMVITMPEFLERRYNPASRTILSVISLISYVLTKVAVTVYAGGLVFQQVFGIETLWGIDFFWIAAIGLVLLTALYTIVGGMKSVLYTSVLQTPILLAGSVIILWLGLKELGGWDEMMRICGEQVITWKDAAGNTCSEGDTMVNLIRSNNDPQYPWLGALIGSAVIGFWYWCTDQFIVQRVLSGKNERESRRGTIFGAYLKLLPVFLFLIPGMIAFALHQKTGSFLPMLANGNLNTDAAFPTLVAKLLPAGVKGLIVCGILAALMSSLASLFNSSAALFTIDFYQRFKPKTDPKKLVRIGQAATIVIVVLGILWIPVMRSVGDVLYLYLQDVQSVLAPGIAAAFLMGICWKRTTPLGGMWGLIAGLVIGLTRLAAKIFYTGAEAADNIFKYIFFDVNWLFFCGWMLVFCLLVVIIVSYFTKPKPEAEIQGLVFGTSTPEQRAATRASWNKWDVIHTVIILGITAAFYWYFW